MSKRKEGVVSGKQKSGIQRDVGKAEGEFDGDTGASLRQE